MKMKNRSIVIIVTVTVLLLATVIIEFIQEPIADGLPLREAIL